MVNSQTRLEEPNAEEDGSDAMEFFFLNKNLMTKTLVEIVKWKKTAATTTLMVSKMEEITLRSSYAEDLVTPV
ncbi:hypothetical protein RUM43_004224 [Polyplax serrata]|uniref:Uncharacterized protein n=1 Tax=Polyplax serrata TaxID=468196 RepID=A0AAN8SAQ2_POLSC